MEKLPMCRICLVQNVRMFVVVNRNLRELYEKLTDIAFVTEDSRPNLACFICCTKLKQCYRLLRQCLEAEELLAQKINEGYEPNPLINQDHLEFYSGFIKSPIVHISIVDKCQTESIAIKEETPAVCEGLDGIIELKEEHKSELVLELENSDNSCLDVADIPPHHSELDLEDDVPLSFAVKEELPAVCERRDDIIEPNEEHQSDDVEPEDNSCLDVADIPPHHSESDLEDDVPLVKFKTEVEEEQEVCKKKRRASETTNTPVAKKLKLDIRRTKIADIIRAEQKQTEPSGSQVIRNTRNYMSKRGTTFKVPSTDTITDVHYGIANTVVHTNSRSNSNKDDLRRKISKEKVVDGDNINSDRRLCIKEKLYQCAYCQRDFRYRKYLISHIRKHTGEKPYKCNVCQRNFSVKRNLTNHIRIHTGEKPYKCDVCQRNFNEKSSLTKHIRIHTGEKPYKCDVCQRSFSQKGHLTQHNRVHTGEKSYKCDICQRSFSLKSNLTSHFRIHIGEKRYKCDVCQRSFSRFDHLKRHIIQVH